MKPKRRPLRSVLLAAIGGVAVGAVVVTGALTVGLLNFTRERAMLQELRRDANVVARRANLAGRTPAVPPCRVLPALGVSEICFVRGDDPLPASSGLDQAEGRGVVGGVEVFYVARPLVARNGTVYVLRPVEGVRSPARQILGRMVVAGAVALGVSAAVAYVLAGRISRPLGELAHAARGGMKTPPPGAASSEPEEVAELRDAFADLSAELSEAHDRERSFLMSVSHELRTPLTAIRGYGEALTDGTVRGTRKAGDVIVSESRRLERLVQDLLDLARMQAGEFSIVTEETDLVRVARQVVEALRPRASEARVTLEVHAEGSSLTVTDPDRAHQLLANLAENALRVTPERGRVVVTVDGSAVEVADAGPGLDAEDIEHAFDRFYLWRKYRGERPVGSGLGLAIVDELARRLDVRIDVTSEPSKGSRFRLEFPPVG